MSNKLSLLLFKFLSELIDLLLLGVKNFKLLLTGHGTASSLRFVAQLVVNISDVPVVGINHLAHVSNVLLLLLDLTIVLLDAVHEALSGLSERKVVFVANELEVVLSLLKISLFFAKNLGALFQIVLLQTSLRIHQSVGDVIKLLALKTDLALQV